MPPRPVDKIRLEGEAGVLDRFNSLTVTNDITAPAEAHFDIGDDGSWKTLESIIAHGKTFKVYLNDKLRLTGRVYVNENPVEVGGVSVQLTVRTKLADAVKASADPRVRVANVSIKDFLVKLYEPLGFSESDFVFAANVERDLMTGVGAKGAKAPADLEAIKPDTAKVNPPEAIFDAASRHLKRYGLMHWDTPDGKIYVGKPDDQQSPLYMLRLRRDRRYAPWNNILGCRRVQDWTDVPSEVQVYGGGVGKDVARQPIRGNAVDLDLFAAGFDARPVIILKEEAKTLAEADAQAKREMSARRKRKDVLEMSAGEWSFWDGSRAVPFAVNTTADVLIDVAGGALGKYYVQRVQCTEDARAGKRTTITAVVQGVWDL